MLIEAWLVNLSQHIEVSESQDELISEECPMIGGSLLKSIPLILEFFEFLGEMFFSVIDTFMELLSIG